MEEIRILDVIEIVAYVLAVALLAKVINWRVRVHGERARLAREAIRSWPAREAPAIPRVLPTCATCSHYLSPRPGTKGIKAFGWCRNTDAGSLGPVAPHELPRPVWCPLLVRRADNH